MPISPSDGEPELNQRLHHGRRYLELLAAPPWQTWRQGYEEYLGGELDCPAALILAHPMWLPAHVNQDRLYGPRRFERIVDQSLYACRADAIWGYPCQMEDQPIEFDHRFPYAFGGPTEAANRLALCAIHNASKSSDVHLFHWDGPEARWLRPLLERMAKRI